MVVVGEKPRGLQTTRRAELRLRGAHVRLDGGLRDSEPLRDVERLQILISSEQRRRLEDEARGRGSSVASLVREAIDARFGGVSADERVRAVESIAALSGRFLPIEELEDVIGEERLRAVPTSR